MKRRDFLSMCLAGSAAVSTHGVAYAQQARGARRVGIVDDGPLWDYFRDRMRELGPVDGRNIAFEYRVGDGNPRELLSAVVELVRVPVDVVAVAGSTAAKAAQSATDAVPIVAIGIGDPVAIGLAEERERPGGNITGNMTIAPDLAAKRLQLLQSMLPSISRIAYFWNPNNASSRTFLDQLQIAAESLDVTMVPVGARSASEFDRAFAIMSTSRIDAMVIAGDAVQQQNADQIVDFQIRQRLPALFTRREEVVAGGLMSYGISVPDLYRRGAEAVHRILAGARPAEIPFEHPARFELVINRKTVRALGLTIPRAVLSAAKEIIE